MSNSNNNEGFIPSGEMLNINDWIDENVPRYFRKHLICTTKDKTSIDQKIDEVSISHVVIWNLIDLKSKLYKAQDYTPSDVLKKAAAKWMNCFRAQVIEEMKQMAKSIYVEYANSRTFVDLQQKGKLYTSFDQLKHATKELDNKLVRKFLFCFTVYIEMF